jgi:hypothetical protein
MSDVLVAERFEDMSPRGRLRVLREQDGDVIVCVIPDPQAHPGQPMLSVEFCTSGGGSPRTHAALLNLLDAMAQDNEDHRCRGRASPQHATPNMHD